MKKKVEERDALYKLSIIVPVFNNGDYIYRNLHEALKTMKKYGKNFEIILVNDGSTDNTLEEVMLIDDPRIKVVSYVPNRGKGYALKYGFNFVSGDVVTFLDADLDIHPRNLKNFFPYLEKADMVIGSKRHRKSTVSYPMRRKIMSFFYHHFVNLLFNLRVKDTQTGLKLIKYGCLREILPRVLVKRFAFDLELLVNAKKCGFKIKEAPIHLQYNFGNASNVSFKAIRSLVQDTLAIAYRLYIKRYYDRKHAVPLASQKSKEIQEDSFKIIVEHENSDAKLARS